MQYLEEKFQECSKRVGVGLATSVETDWFDDENEAAGSKGESEKEKV